MKVRPDRPFLILLEEHMMEDTKNRLQRDKGEDHYADDWVILIDLRPY